MTPLFVVSLLLMAAPSGDGGPVGNGDGSKAAALLVPKTIRVVHTKHGAEAEKKFLGAEMREWVIITFLAQEPLVFQSTGTISPNIVVGDTPCYHLIWRASMVSCVLPKTEGRPVSFWMRQEAWILRSALATSDRTRLDELHRAASVRGDRVFHLGACVEQSEVVVDDYRALIKFLESPDER